MSGPAEQRDIRLPIFHNLLHTAYKEPLRPPCLALYPSPIQVPHILPRVMILTA